MTNIFQEPPLVAYSRDRSLVDNLAHGKLNKMQFNESVDNGRRCNEKCLVCDMLERGIGTKGEFP